MQKSCGNAAIPTALLEFLFRFLFFCISDFLDFCQSICVCHVPCERCQCRVSLWIQNTSVSGTASGSIVPESQKPRWPDGSFISRIALS